MVTNSGFKRFWRNRAAAPRGAAWTRVCALSCSTIAVRARYHEKLLKAAKRQKLAKRASLESSGHRCLTSFCDARRVKIGDRKWEFQFLGKWAEKSDSNSTYVDRYINPPESGGSLGRSSFNCICSSEALLWCAKLVRIAGELDHIQSTRSRQVRCSCRPRLPARLHG